MTCIILMAWLILMTCCIHMTCTAFSRIFWHEQLSMHAADSCGLNSMSTAIQMQLARVYLAPFLHVPASFQMTQHPTPHEYTQSSQPSCTHSPWFHRLCKVAGGSCKRVMFRSPLYLYILPANWTVGIAWLHYITDRVVWQCSSDTMSNACHWQSFSGTQSENKSFIILDTRLWRHPALFARFL